MSVEEGIIGNIISTVYLFYNCSYLVVTSTSTIRQTFDQMLNSLSPPPQSAKLFLHIFVFEPYNLPDLSQCTYDAVSAVTDSSEKEGCGLSDSAASRPGSVPLSRVLTFTMLWSVLCCVTIFSQQQETSIKTLKGRFLLLLA